MDSRCASMILIRRTTVTSAKISPQTRPRVCSQSMCVTVPIGNLSLNVVVANQPPQCPTEVNTHSACSLSAYALVVVFPSNSVENTNASQSPGCLALQPLSAIPCSKLWYATRSGGQHQHLRTGSVRHVRCRMCQTWVLWHRRDRR
jgi:hypothetical protein